MDVTEALVRQVARLARLELSDEEVATTVPQLARILAHVESVASIDTKGADPSSVEAVPTSTLRADVPVTGLDRREVLANAPATDQVFFLVPRVLEQD